MGCLDEKTILGIDPGKNGAWAVVMGTGEVVEWGHFDERNNWDIANADFAMLEKVSSRPGQGVVSAFTFGMNYGIWQGLLESDGIPFEFVAPQKWQKNVLDTVPAPISKPKDESATDGRKRLAENKKVLKTAIVDFVKRKYPELREYLSMKKNWDVADAVCIALYGLKRIK